MKKNASSNLKQTTARRRDPAPAATTPPPPDGDSGAAPVESPAAMKAGFRNPAAVLYETYCREVGGKAFNGAALPGWDEFAADPGKQVQAQAWMAVAEQVHRGVSDKKLEPTIEVTMPDIQKYVGQWRREAMPHANGQTVLMEFRASSRDLVAHGGHERAKECLVQLLHYAELSGFSLICEREIP